AALFAGELIKMQPAEVAQPVFRDADFRGGDAQLEHERPLPAQGPRFLRRREEVFDAQVPDVFRRPGVSRTPHRALSPDPHVVAGHSVERCPGEGVTPSNIRRIVFLSFRNARRYVMRTALANVSRAELQVLLAPPGLAGATLRADSSCIAP